MEQEAPVKNKKEKSNTNLIYTGYSEKEAKQRKDHIQSGGRPSFGRMTHIGGAASMEKVHDRTIFINCEAHAGLVKCRVLTFRVP